MIAASTKDRRETLRHLMDRAVDSMSKMEARLGSYLDQRPWGHKRGWRSIPPVTILLLTYYVCRGLSDPKPDAPVICQVCTGGQWYMGKSDQTTRWHTILTC